MFLWVEFFIAKKIKYIQKVLIMCKESILARALKSKI